MKSKVFILHGCPSDEKKAQNVETRTYDKHWMPWVEKELTDRGYQVLRPLMPEPWAPKYNAFKKEFEKNAVFESDILVGHSCGGAFLVRWLGDTKAKVKKLILVAPWKIPDERDQGRIEFYGFKIDKSISERVSEIVMFTSDTEDDDGKKSVQIYHKALGGKLIELPNKGHYVESEMGTTEFPELLTEIV